MFLRDADALESLCIEFSAGFILGGQIAGEPPRLFNIYAAGNFWYRSDSGNALLPDPGESKYGKPIIDRVLQLEAQIRTPSGARSFPWIDPALQSLGRCPSQMIRSDGLRIDSHQNIDTGRNSVSTPALVRSVASAIARGDPGQMIAAVELHRRLGRQQIIASLPSPDTTDAATAFMPRHAGSSWKAWS